MCNHICRGTCGWQCVTLRKSQTAFNSMLSSSSAAHQAQAQHISLRLTASWLRLTTPCLSRLNASQLTPNTSTPLLKQSVCVCRGVVHRDLKLENLLLATPNDIHKVKIADFGLAKKAAESAMATICGTPQYVAPEVIQVLFCMSVCPSVCLSELWCPVRLCTEAGRHYAGTDKVMKLVLLLSFSQKPCKDSIAPKKSSTRYFFRMDKDPH